MTTVPYWSEFEHSREFPSLNADLNMDVAVVGGGSTGITAAYLLTKAGMSVALFERDRLMRGNTWNTTAHLTHVSDLRIGHLVRRFGRDYAAAVWEAGNAAIRQIESIAEAEEIECDFARIPGFLHASIKEDRDERSELQRESDLASELGFPASYVDSVPVFQCPGISYPNQGRLHSTKYFSGILDRLVDEKCLVYENTIVTEFSEHRRQMIANGHRVNFNFVVIATGVPLMGRTGWLVSALLQSKMAQYTSYAIGASVPPGSVPDALFWDTGDPYFYMRIAKEPSNDYVIFGGADHKTGQKSGNESFKYLKAVLHHFIPKAEVTHQWSGQVVESVDGLPYIGETAERQFVATGFSGNGLTFGTLAAMMAVDCALGRSSAWTNLFDVKRKKLSTLWNYLTENADFPYYMVKDRLKSRSGPPSDSVNEYEGKVLTVGDRLAAVYRNGLKELTYLSPICPHLGCLVDWNQDEETWDCPCHGSRFRPTGDVLAGPAESPLEPLNLANKDSCTRPHSVD